MYTRLTKVVNVNGVDCVSCTFYGTSECHIHKGNDIPNCAQCKVMAAMLNQLRAFEELVEENTEQKLKEEP
jgi:hypothetical protein